MITDGEPQGEQEGVVEQVVQRLKDDEANKLLYSRCGER